MLTVTENMKKDNRNTESYSTIFLVHPTRFSRWASYKVFECIMGSIHEFPLKLLIHILNLISVRLLSSPLRFGYELQADQFCFTNDKRRTNVR